MEKEKPQITIKDLNTISSEYMKLGTNNPFIQYNDIPKISKKQPNWIKRLFGIFAVTFFGVSGVNLYNRYNTDTIEEPSQDKYNTDLKMIYAQGDEDYKRAIVKPECNTEIFIDLQNIDVRNTHLENLKKNVGGEKNIIINSASRLEFKEECRQKLLETEAKRIEELNAKYNEMQNKYAQADLNTTNMTLFGIGGVMFSIITIIIDCAEKKEAYHLNGKQIETLNKMLDIYSTFLKKLDITSLQKDNEANNISSNLDGIMLEESLKEFLDHLKHLPRNIQEKLSNTDLIAEMEKNSKNMIQSAKIIDALANCIENGKIKTEFFTTFEEESKKYR
jgi:hypothetical protein